MRSACRKWQNGSQIRGAILYFGFLCTPSCIRATNPPPFGYKSVKIHRIFHFSPENQRFPAGKNLVGLGFRPCQIVVLLRF